MNDNILVDKFKKLRSSHVVVILLTFVVMFIFEVVVLYTFMFPNLLKVLGTSLSIIELEYLSSILNKVVLGLSVWAVILFFAMLFLLDLVRMINQYFRSERKH